jgi:hypothetical protein
MNRRPSVKPPLAYEVSDGDEQMVIIFASTNAAARRLGAKEMDIDFDEVDSCRRRSQYDQYSPGPVPPLVLIDNGWWFECHGCGRKICADPWDEENETDVGPENAVQAPGSGLYCSEVCKADSDQQKAECKAVEAAGVAAMVRYLMSGTPIARVERTHGFASYSSRHGRIELQRVVVDFSLPGIPQAGSVRYEKDYSGLPSKVAKAHAQIYLTRASLPVFEDYHVRRYIEEGWDRWDDDGGALHSQSERQWAAA